MSCLVPDFLQNFKHWNQRFTFKVLRFFFLFFFLEIYCSRGYHAHSFMKLSVNVFSKNISLYRSTSFVHLVYPLFFFFLFYRIYRVVCRIFSPDNYVAGWHVYQREKQNSYQLYSSSWEMITSVVVRDIKECTYVIKVHSFNVIHITFLFQNTRGTELPGHVGGASRPGWRRP